MPRIGRIRVTTFQTTWNSLTFPVGAGKDLIIGILFNAMINSHCFTLIKNRPGSQGFKHCNRLTEDYNSVNEEHIPTPGPQAGNSCNFSFSACSNFKMKQISVTLTYSWFSRWVVTLNTQPMHEKTLRLFKPINNNTWHGAGTQPVMVQKQNLSHLCAIDEK